MKMTWQDVIRDRLATTGTSQAELAHRMELTPGAIAHYLTGIRKTRIEDVASMMKNLGVETITICADAYIVDADPAPSLGPVEGRNSVYPKRFPVLTPTQAGVVLDLNVNKPYQFKDMIEWHETTELAGTRSFWMRVSGDIMNTANGPSFPDGTLILVDPDRTTINGSFVVAKLAKIEEVTFKKFIIDAGQKYLKPLNPYYPMLPIRDECRIVGVVIDAKYKLF